MRSTSFLPQLKKDFDIKPVYLSLCVSVSLLSLSLLSLSLLSLSLLSLFLSLFSLYLFSLSSVSLSPISLLSLFSFALLSLFLSLSLLSLLYQSIYLSIYPPNPSFSLSSLSISSLPLSLSLSLKGKKIEVSLLPTSPHLRCLPMAVPHVVFAYALLSHLNHLRSPGFLLTCGRWCCRCSLNFSRKERRHLYEIIMTVSDI